MLKYKAGSASVVDEVDQLDNVPSGGDDADLPRRGSGGHAGERVAAREVARVFARTRGVMSQALARPPTARTRRPSSLAS